ncbi:tRNA 2-selenouridine(34) synthase MnmH [Paenibacillus tarimensis]|uniref:tRNA 2-selenouridine(34) synthase MnmH n=1 Tax=Paenibacillus tarimensis TaxID=416012 RepID=UPI001F15C792|nr:tRNA 2-selenouridine(34) synthase MnmH [Paenibacillus tarimensis]MCF2942866.1 tRNA 2-selenouridine(34) synthase MnmH [Paenibacillus tarimensis]
MFQDITVDELLELHRKGNIALIDVRSPSEFSDSTIPGSLNIPIFNDEERAEIGTLYKQVSVDAAKDKGLEIVSAKLPSFIKAIEAAGSGRKAVFCWRGGMRSRTSATLASLMGLRMYRLNGGYRAYRKWVVETIERLTELPHCYVINGYTGSGKTELLDKLAERGYPVINLERMAQHRGSIFGQIGLKPNNQKTFDSLLVQELIRCADSPYLILEAESRRIGKVIVPEPVIAAKEKGTSLFIEMPVHERARNIVREYRPGEHKEACLESFERIEKRIHTPVAADIRTALQEDRFEEAVELMLVHYYDPRYQFAADRYGQGHLTIRNDSEQGVLDQIIAQLPPPVFPAK